MKFLVDAQLPPALCGWLAAQGHEAHHVGNLGLLAASDQEIAKVAQERNFVLVSKNEDFVSLRLPDHFALLWVRCGNVTKRALIEWIEPRWAGVMRLLDSGERFIELC